MRIIIYVLCILGFLGLVCAGFFEELKGSLEATSEAGR